MTQTKSKQTSFLVKLNQDPGLQVQLVFGLWIGAFMLLCAYYMPFLSDDALISLRYAERLAAGEGLTWTDGPRVEGYTDLLWVLLHVPFAVLRLDLIVVTRLIGCAGALAGMLAMAIDPLSLKLQLGRMLGGMGFLALLVPYAVWAIGGLEHGCMAGLVCVALVQTERFVRLDLMGEKASAQAWWATRWAWTGNLAALTLMRADGILLAGLICVGVTLSGIAQGMSRKPLRGLVLALRGGSGAVAAYLLQLAFRVAYYGELVPNTARAKVSVELVRWELGLQHLLGAYSATLVGLVLVCVALICARSRGLSRVLPALCASLGWCAYQVYVGGDIFPAYRQLLLGLAPLAHVVAVGFESFERPRLRPGTFVGFGGLIAAHLFTQMSHPENLRGKTERWEWGGASIGPLLKAAFGARSPLLGVDAAGALPFWSGLPTLDLLGLNDRYLATHRPANFGKGGIGHELGDAQYYLDRKVDLFAFCGAVGNEKPCFEHSKRMVQLPEFRNNYRMVRLLGLTKSPVHGAIFVRLDGKLGMERTEDTLKIPAYFLASEESSVRASFENDKIGVTLRVGGLGIVEGLKLLPGRYRLEAGKFPLSWGMRCHGRDARRVSHAPVIEVKGEQAIDLLLAHHSNAGESQIEELVLTRVTEEPGLVCSTSSLPLKAELLGPPIEGAEWRAPPAVIVPQRGHLALSIRHKGSKSQVEVVADNNDQLKIQFVSGEQSSSWISVPAVPGAGMRLRHVALPSDMPSGEEIEVRITQAGGDGRASVSSVAFK